MKTRLVYARGLLAIGFAIVCLGSPAQRHVGQSIRECAREAPTGATLLTE
jgi:hypothetical protein